VRIRCLLVSWIVAALLLSGCDTKTDRSKLPTGERIATADAEPENWLSHGRNYQETRHSPLDQINHANVAKLGLAWFHDLDTQRGQQATPLVVDGRLYTSSAWSKVQAFDAVSGELLWQYDPQVHKSNGAKACCDVVNRGVAFWNGLLYVGTIDGRLIAIDTESGTPRWDSLTVDRNKSYTITGAPRVVKDRVIIGNSGGEFGVRGYVSAYDAATGKLVWRFYTVPGEPGKKDGAVSDAVLESISETWARDAWAHSGGGGGTVWDAMAYDPVLDLLYIGVGNASFYPQAFRSPKTGGNNDNLFVGSVLALRPETGEYVWHYQETPGDQWDYTSTQHMILTDMDIGGKRRQVLLHAPKNGFFYVIDRASGELLSAEPYGPVNWASGVDMQTGRPIVHPDADYTRSGKAWSGKPSTSGFHNWPPMAYSPKTRLVYIPVMNTTAIFDIDPAFEPLPHGYNVGIKMLTGEPPDDPREIARLRALDRGALLAWDPQTQREAWRVPLEGSWNGGVLSTAGDLVFQGNMQGEFAAYNAFTGKKLWSFDAQNPITAAPIAWAKDGRQYITVLAGWGGAAALGGGPLSWTDSGPRVNRSRVLTFALDAKKALPSVEPPPARALQTPPQFADQATIDIGKQAYHRSCFACHGFVAISGGVTPDLRYSPVIGDKTAWDRIVMDGVLHDRGMISYKETFTAQQIEAIRAYVISRAHTARQWQTSPPPQAGEGGA
jgi:quinohemoprotein ethanol dehydrogenase